MKPPKWQEFADTLEEMAEDLPQPSEAQMANLRSTGQNLSAVLKAADWQHEERIEAALLERYLGVSWDPDLPPTLLLCLKLRFEWAQAVLDGIRQYGLGQPPDDLPYQLLVSSWDQAGFEYSHENFLQNYHLALLDEILPSDPGEPGD